MPFDLDDQSYRLQGFPPNLSKLWTSAASSTATPATTESTRSEGIENLFLVKETQNLSLHDFLPGYNRYCARQPLSGNPAIARRRTPQIQPTVRPTPPMVKTRSPRSKSCNEILSRHFVVEASGEAVASDYNSVFSRLVLCKTFRLEEDGKVSPDRHLCRRFLVTHVHSQQHSNVLTKY